MQALDCSHRCAKELDSAAESSSFARQRQQLNACIQLASGDERDSIIIAPSYSP